MTTTSRINNAADIRAEFKRLGWSSRDIGVRSDGCAIRVTIKNPTILRDVVEKVAKQAEHIRYCEHSGEILSGGNTFVSVTYDTDAKKAMGGPHVEALRDAAAKAAEVPRTLIPIASAPGWSIEVEGIRHNNFRIWVPNERQLRNQSHCSDVYIDLSNPNSVRCAAEHFGECVLNSKPRG